MYIESILGSSLSAVNPCMLDELHPTYTYDIYDWLTKSPTGEIFEVGAQFHNNYLTKSFILFLNKKLEDNKGNE